MAATVRADEAITRVLKVVTELPAFVAGSSVAAEQHAAIVGDYAYSDVDVFCASQNALIAAGQRFIADGWTVDDRHVRVWDRWLAFGFNKWHTNSLKLTKNDVEVNVIYKLVDGHPTTTLSQVLESFDFGFLAMGYDARDGVLRDMRSYFFPSVQDFTKPLPLLPVRREAWINGFISQYQGMRQVGRYIKYLDYGYDLSKVKPDMIEGYKQVGNYMIDRGDQDKVLLGQIYHSFAMSLEDNDLDKLRAAAAEILYLDDLDAIMEKLE